MGHPSKRQRNRQRFGKARAAGDIDNASLSYGQDAGLIDSIKSVKDVVQDIIAEAEEIIREQSSNLVRQSRQ